MAIFAHPDDEGIVAGTLAHYAHNNTEVMLVCATKGEVGEISEAAQSQGVTPENLGRVREKELAEACRILGVQHLEFLNYRDSGMDGTPENEDTRALVQADTAEVSAKIVGLIRRFQPDAIVTFEPFGWYGHPDHIFVSKWVTAAFPLASNPSIYSDGGPAWQPQSLFHSVLPFTKFRALLERAVEEGYIEENGFGEDIPEELLLKTEAAVTHVLDMRAYNELRNGSMMAHLTQFGEDNLFRKIPEEMVSEFIGKEYFIQVFPEPQRGPTQNLKSDLFE